MTDDRLANGSEKHVPPAIGIQVQFRLPYFYFSYKNKMTCSVIVPSQFSLFSGHQLKLYSHHS